jgi:hypothetical protein
MQNLFTNSKTSIQKFTQIHNKHPHINHSKCYKQSIHQHFTHFKNKFFRNLIYEIITPLASVPQDHLMPFNSSPIASGNSTEPMYNTCIKSKTAPVQFSIRGKGYKIWNCVISNFIL